MLPDPGCLRTALGGLGLAAVAQSWVSGKRKWPEFGGGGAAVGALMRMTIPGCEGCERGSRDLGVAVYRRAGV